MSNPNPQFVDVPDNHNPNKIDTQKLLNGKLIHNIITS